MKPINVLGIDTPHGFRTIELLEGDIASVEMGVDVLVVSAFEGSYHPSPGTVLGAIRQRHNISLVHHARQPALDLRDALGIWVSKPLGQASPYGRILCVEIVGTPLSLTEALDNVFAGLMLLSAKHLPTGVIVLPLLGAGLQQLDPDTVASELVPRAREYIERAPGTTRLVFVEIDTDKAQRLSNAIDNLLGRARVSLPQEQLVGALRQDVANRLRHARSLFEPDCTDVRDDWLRLLQTPVVRSIEFGVLARKLVELMLSRLGVPSQALFKRIRTLEEGAKIAPWICGYMHVLRHLGNESAHENSGAGNREPRVVAPADLTAGLFCVERLLDFWIERDSSPAKHQHQ